MSHPNQSYLSNFLDSVSVSVRGCQTKFESQFPEEQVENMV